MDKPKDETDWLSQSNSLSDEYAHMYCSKKSLYNYSCTLIIKAGKRFLHLKHSQKTNASLV